MEKKMKISLNELFSGIGAQRKALLKLGFEVDVVGVSEIDKYAIQSYEAIFGETRNYGDICDVPRLDYADLWTYSFPCQDISVAGHQKGINENTRSGLLYQVQRLLEVAKEENALPKYLLLENVKNLVGKQFKKQFEEWIEYLEEIGYKTYWQVLNAKDYGIPQNRERVFAVSIRKDIDLNFAFPPKMKLQKRLKDLLEQEVDEKFYLSQDKVQNLIKTLENKEISNTIIAGGRGSLDRHQWDLVAVKETNPVRLGNIYGEDKGTGFAGNVWDKNAISPTLTTMQGGNREPMIIEAGYYPYPNSDKKHQSNVVYSAEGIAPTLDTMQGGNRQPKILEENIRIRKLTPLECWRLMGFDDEDFYKAQKSGVSNTQLYKQAGNSIVVDVLEEIFTNFVEW